MSGLDDAARVHAAFQRREGERRVREAKAIADGWEAARQARVAKEIEAEKAERKERERRLEADRRERSKAAEEKLRAWNGARQSRPDCGRRPVPAPPCRRAALPRSGMGGRLTWSGLISGAEDGGAA